MSTLKVCEHELVGRLTYLPVQDFEVTLHEVVNAKRLSASKMNRLTDIAMKTLEDDTKLVAILYRTHKSLPISAKVSSLYAFDALARAARSSVIKHGTTGDINSEKGNAATFLLKIEGILEGLFQDMITIDNPEAKRIVLTAIQPQEKTKKVLDIWIKSNTFPSAVLTRLRDMLADTPKGAYHDRNTYPLSISSARNSLAKTRSGCFPLETAVNPTPPGQHVAAEAPAKSTTPPLPPPSAASNSDVQSTLLSLLGQAAQATGHNPTSSQTPPNNSPISPQLNQAQLTLLQQLALTAKLGNGLQSSQPAVSAPPHAVNNQPSTPLNSTSDTSRLSPRPPSGPYSRPNLKDGDPRYGSAAYSERPRDRNEHADDRFPRRGGQRGGYRGRRDRWDDRGRDGFRQRDRERDPPSRPRDSRSRSPRRFEGRSARQYSPPSRHLNGKDSYRTEPSGSDATSGKDEFGRDIRPSSVTPPRSAAGDDTPVQGLMAPSVVPDPAAAPDCRVPVPDQLPSVAANTPAQSTETHASSSAPSEQPGLDQFDITTFDATAPSSWEVLGTMWKTTYGYLPSQEELLQFVLAGGMAIASAAGGHYANTQDDQWAGQGSGGSGRRGRGRGYMNGRGGHSSHGDYREAGHHWDYTNVGQSHYSDSDAVVLGDSGGDPQGEVDQYTVLEHSSGPDESNVGGTQSRGAGRMERVGERWVFVREPAS
ncbi:hypothetical protein ID866_6710 [Astraeus odoratus]|nr:hypothetical protein ID866_6710 [Astraeus odoratus]